MDGMSLNRDERTSAKNWFDFINPAFRTLSTVIYRVSLSLFIEIVEKVRAIDRFDRYRS